MSKDVQVQQIDVKLIKPSTDNPRTDVGDLKDLAASIKDLEVLAPVIVTADNGAYQLVVGHRRLAAAKQAGLKTIPGIVKELTDQQRLQTMMAENLHRKDLDPFEEARGYELLAASGMSHRQIAELVGRSSGQISKRRSLLALPAPVRKAVGSSLTIEEASELGKLADAPEAITRIIDRRKNAPWTNIPASVSKELEEIESEKANVAKATELRAEGVRVLDAADRGKFRPLEQKEGWRVGTSLELTVAKHKAEPCHAAAITHGGVVVWVCDSPSRHSAKGESKLKIPTRKAVPKPGEQKETRAQKIARENAAALEEAAAKRLEFMRTLCSGRVKRQGLLEHLAAQLARSVAEVALDDWLPRVNRILAEVEEGEAVIRNDDYVTTEVVALADGDSEDQVALGLAIALGLGEELADVAGGWSPSWGNPVIVAHFKFLRSRGYKQSKVEREKLAAEKSKTKGK